MSSSSPLDRSALLPREGFHADVLGRLLKYTLLNPLVTLPLYAYLALVPRGRQLTTDHPAFLKFTRFAAVLAALRWLNNYLERRALNNNVTDRYDWSKEIVLVTGGADGIGRRVVQGLAAKGVTTVVLDVQPLTYERPSNCHYFACDITSESAVADVASQIKEAVGAPTVLVNNAGVCRGRHLLETSEEDVELTFEVNALSHYRLARAFCPNMVALNHGMVVTVASSAAWITAAQMTEYAASKAAAVSFHEGLTAELATHYKAPKVRTVLVCQGYTRTSLFQGFGVKSNAFFGPSLDVDTVAEAIVRKILSGTSGHLVLPGIYNLVASNTRSLPWWAQDGARKGLGHLMSEWHGRQVGQKRMMEKASGSA